MHRDFPLSRLSVHTTPSAIEQSLPSGCLFSSFFQVLIILLSPLPYPKALFILSRLWLRWLVSWGRQYFPSWSQWPSLDVGEKRLQVLCLGEGDEENSPFIPASEWNIHKTIQLPAHVGHFPQYKSNVLVGKRSEFFLLFATKTLSLFPFLNLSLVWERTLKEE